MSSTVTQRRSTPVGGKKPIPPPPKTYQKKPVPAPLKAQVKPSPAATSPRPLKPNTPVSRPPTTTTPKLPTVTTKPSQSSTSRPKPHPSSQPNKLPTVTTTSARPAQYQDSDSGNWINRTVQNRIANVGNYAGGLVNTVGNSVNRIGEGLGDAIANTTRSWGQGVAGYGNDIKDSVGVGGPRASTASNPLGLAGQGKGQGQKGTVAPQGGRGRSDKAQKGNAKDPLGIEK